VTPAVRLLAKKLRVDLNTLQGSGSSGVITKEDVEKAANQSSAPQVQEGFEPIKGVRRAMLQSMIEAHAQVVPATIYDEVDIHHWPVTADLTVRLIQAIAFACQEEPALNAWFDHTQLARKCFQEVNVGLAVDSEAGLFVPVLHQVNQSSEKDLRETINRFKQQIQDRSLPAEDLKGATITLSNFGKFAGRFATPIIVPPTVAILGVGKTYDAVVPFEKKPMIHSVLPLSLTFDHRAVTGGEATRFLGAVIQALKTDFSHLC
jgi:2-oxoisovalerate dehydrogenase E2 component (dihydrolipoyl transacylase)